ncbi:MAG: dockerin type I domain-containing protein [Lachnospiraceae bacterium]
MKKSKLLSMLLTVSMVMSQIPMAAVPSVKAETEVVTVTLDPSEESAHPFDGWGTSLCWGANRLGANEKMTKQAAEFFFSEEGLNLDIARYNIGGGDDPEHNHIIRSDSVVPGYWKSYELSEDGKDVTIEYDWSQDENQRNFTKAVMEVKPEVYIEGFSNSPPYFMTVSGCATGGLERQTDNLKTDMVDDFARYIAEVSKHFKEEFHIPFQTYSPMNEPSGGGWTAYSTKQEGCNFMPGTDIRDNMINETRKALDEAGMPEVGVVGPDESGITATIQNVPLLKEETLNNLERIDAHTYGEGNRDELRKLARSLGKKLWMSENDNGGTVANAGEMKASLNIAQKIIKDMNGMKPSAWCLWNIIDKFRDANYYYVNANGEKVYSEKDAVLSQDGGLWGVGMGNFDTEEIELSQKYYAFGQFTKFIRPGDTIIDSSTTTTASYNKKTGKITIVAVNSTAEKQAYHFDLSNFTKTGSNVNVIRTSGTYDQGEHWASVEAATVQNESFTYDLIPYSITTFIIDPVEDIDYITVKGEEAIYYTDSAVYTAYTLNSDEIEWSVSELDKVVLTTMEDSSQITLSAAEGVTDANIVLTAQNARTGATATFDVEIGTHLNYAITTDGVTMDIDQARDGSTVVIADANVAENSVIVYDTTNSSLVDVTNNQDGTYSFVMPKGEVTVSGLQNTETTVYVVPSEVTRVSGNGNTNTNNYYISNDRGLGMTFDIPDREFTGVASAKLYLTRQNTAAASATNIYDQTDKEAFEYMNTTKVRGYIGRHTGKTGSAELLSVPQLGGKYKLLLAWDESVVSSSGNDYYVPNADVAKCIPTKASQLPYLELTVAETTANSIQSPDVTVKDANTGAVIDNAVLGVVVEVSGENIAENSVVVYDSTNQLPVHVLNNYDGTYSFVMPAGQVQITRLTNTDDMVYVVADSVERVNNEGTTDARNYYVMNNKALGMTFTVPEIEGKSIGASRAFFTRSNTATSYLTNIYNQSSLSEFVYTNSSTDENLIGQYSGDTVTDGISLSARPVMGGRYKLLFACDENVDASSGNDYYVINPVGGNAAAHAKVTPKNASQLPYIALMLQDFDGVFEILGADSVTKGKTAKYTYHTDVAEIQSVTWSVDNTDLAEIDQTGTLIAKSAGIVNVIAQSAEYTAKKQVSITPKYNTYWNTYADAFTGEAEDSGIVWHKFSGDSTAGKYNIENGILTIEDDGSGNNPCYGVAAVIKGIAPNTNYEITFKEKTNFTSVNGTYGFYINADTHSTTDNDIEIDKWPTAEVRKNGTFARVHQTVVEDTDWEEHTYVWTSGSGLKDGDDIYGAKFIFTLRNAQGSISIKDVVIKQQGVEIDENPAAELDVDFNGDDKISAVDALCLLQSFTTASVETADVNGDGRLDEDDVLCILEYATGKITSFPGEK